MIIRPAVVRNATMILRILNRGRDGRFMRMICSLSRATNTVYECVSLLQQFLLYILSSVNYKLSIYIYCVFQYIPKIDILSKAIALL